MNVAVPFTLLLAPLVLWGCPGRDPKKDKEEDDVGQDLPDPGVTLVVAGMDPPRARVDEVFTAEVFGTGFVRGAKVTLSGGFAPRTEFVDDASLSVNVPPLPAGTYDVTVTNPDGSAATLRRGLVVDGTATTGCARVTVHFELDSSGLFPADLEALRSATQCYLAAGGTVRIEGHCDERGTTEYNLALGQRRADAVAAYLAGAGLPRGRMSLVSFGEERPEAGGSGDDVWAQNRRGVVYLEE